MTPEQIDAQIEQDPDMQSLAQNDETAFLSKHAEMYRAMGYNPDGSPLRRAQKAIQGFSQATGIPEGVTQFGATALIPMVGTMAGGFVGAAGGPMGVAVGASGGSVLGEAANSLLGITDPMDKTDLALAAGAPLLGPALSKATPAILGGLKRLVPGTAAGLNEMVGERLAKHIGGMRVTRQHVDDARAVMNAVPDFRLEANATREIFTSETASVARQALMGIPGSDTYLKALNKVVADSGVGVPGKVSFKDLMTLEEGFNRIKGGKADEVWGAASGRIIDDIEAATLDPKLTQATVGKATSGLAAFKAFITTNRKYHADETLVSMFTPGGKVMKLVAGDPSLVQFDRKAFTQMVTNNADLKKAFSPSEIDSIKDAVSSLGYIKKMPSGSGDVVNLAKRYGAGGMIGWVAGGPVGALAGAGIEEMLRAGVTTEMGRKAVKYLAKEGRGTIKAIELQSILGKIAMGASAGFVSGMKDSPSGSQPFTPQE